MDKDEAIEYAIRTSEEIKEEKKTELINYFYNKKEVIDKSIEYINQHWVIDEPVWFKNDLLDILKGEKQE